MWGICQEQGLCQAPLNSPQLGVPTSRSSELPTSHGQPELSRQGTKNLPSPSRWGPKSYCKNCHAMPASGTPPELCGGVHPALHAAHGCGSSRVFFACFGLGYFLGGGKDNLNIIKASSKAWGHIFFLFFTHKPKLGVLVSTPWLQFGVVVVVMGVGALCLCT